MTLIKDRLQVDAVLTPGGTGQFDVIADDVKIAARGGNVFTRALGMGYPDLAGVVDDLERHLTGRT